MGVRNMKRQELRRLRGEDAGCAVSDRGAAGAELFTVRVRSCLTSSQGSLFSVSRIKLKVPQPRPAS